MPTLTADNKLTTFFIRTTTDTKKRAQCLDNNMVGTIDF